MMLVRRGKVHPGGFSRRSRRYGQGFTLIELLVALLIFALLAVMSYGGLGTVLEAQQGFERHNDRLAELQMLFLVLGRDIEQAVDRPIRDGFGDPQPALQGGSDGLELTRGGRRNPAGVARSQLQRVGWMVDAGQLQRLSWGVLDRAQDSEPDRQTMIDQVTGMELRFLDQQGQWRSQWPVAGGNDKQADLPRAVEVTIELEDWGRVIRLYQVLTSKAQPEAKG